MAQQTDTGSNPRPRSGAGLYVHVPFCSAICPYCDFAVQRNDPSHHQRYLSAVVAEMQTWRNWDVPIDTVYLGGGTPSALAIEDLQRLLRGASEHLPITPDSLLHLEVNPEDVTPSNVASWRDLGVHMISLGVQSMVDAELRQLGRRHNAEQARTAIEACIAAGFHTVSVDIMFGLPGQSRESLQETLTDVAALQPQHVSCYQLTVHEGTTFGRWRERGKLHEMGEDDQAARFAQVHDQLAVAGLVAYEVSNYAADPVHQSAHNQKYWRHTPYLGLGPSAHSFDGESRWWNVRPLDEYATRISRGETPIADREQLSAADTALETVMLRIRTKEGIDLDAFEQRFGYRLETDNANLIARLKLDGYLLQDNPKRLQPTRTGLAVADGIAAQLAIRE